MGVRILPKSLWQTSLRGLLGDALFVVLRVSFGGACEMASEDGRKGDGFETGYWR